MNLPRSFEILTVARRLSLQRLVPRISFYYLKYTWFHGGILHMYNHLFGRHSLGIIGGKGIPFAISATLCVNLSSTDSMLMPFFGSPHFSYRRWYNNNHHHVTYCIVNMDNLLHDWGSWCCFHWDWNSTTLILVLK